jgi:hypothetical protein
MCGFSGWTDQQADQIRKRKKNMKKKSNWKERKKKENG